MKVRGLVVGSVLLFSSACVLLVDPHAGGAHCALTPAASDCVACLARHCQAPIDACCTEGTCNDIVTVLEGCASRHDATCGEIGRRTASPDAAEAQLARCASAECAGLCNTRSGTSASQCSASRSGEGTCSCQIKEPTTDFECSAVTYPAARCCASPSWPGAGLVCSCSPVVCVPSGDGCFCSLNAYATPGSQATCNDVYCCATQDACRCNPTTPCKAPEQPVATCSLDAIGCSNEMKRVTSCSVRTPP